MLERHLAMVRIASHRTAGNVSIVMCNYNNHKLIFIVFMTRTPKKNKYQIHNKINETLNVTTITIDISTVLAMYEPMYLRYLNTDYLHD